MEKPVVTQQPDVSFDRIATRPYTPDGGVDGAGLVVISAAGAVTGVLTGAAFAFIGQWIYAIILFPLVMGAIVGSAQIYVIRKAKVRNTFACGLAGLVAGLAVVCTMHLFDYQMFLREREEDQAGRAELLAWAEQEAEAPAELKAALEEYEQDPEVKAYREVDSFWSYLDWSAKQGVELSSSRHSTSSPLNLGYTGTIIYWLVDALLIAGVTIFMTREQAAEPFCTECDRWKEEVEMGYLGADAKLVSKVLESGDLRNLAYSANDLCTLSIHLCGQCQDSEDIVVQVKKITYNNGQQVKADAGRYLCDEAGVAQLSRLFEAAQEPSEALDEESQKLLDAANEVYANA